MVQADRDGLAEEFAARYGASAQAAANAAALERDMAEREVLRPARWRGNADTCIHACMFTHIVRRRAGQPSSARACSCMAAVCPAVLGPKSEVLDLRLRCMFADVAVRSARP